jgi:phosphoribosylformylglycinamidine (FGAM) synthase PurS component
MTSFRYAVNVTPKPGILDPGGRAVEGSLGHLGIAGVAGFGSAAGSSSTSTPTRRLHAPWSTARLGLLSNPLIEAYDVELLGKASSTSSASAGAAGGGAGEA